MSTLTTFKSEILENAEKLFLTAGFCNFQILDLSEILSVDSKIIQKCFISKGEILLTMLTEVYLDVFRLNRLLEVKKLPLVTRKRIFKEINFLHKRKIKLFLSFIEKNEIIYLDGYLRTLFSRTTSLHFRLFLFQFSFEDSIFLRTNKAKNSYYNLFTKFKTKDLEAF